MTGNIPVNFGVRSAGTAVRRLLDPLFRGGKSSLEIARRVTVVHNVSGTPAKTSPEAAAIKSLASCLANHVQFCSRLTDLLNAYPQGFLGEGTESAVEQLRLQPQADAQLTVYLTKAKEAFVAQFNQLANGCTKQQLDSAAMQLRVVRAIAALKPPRDSFLDSGGKPIDMLPSVMDMHIWSGTLSFEVNVDAVASRLRRKRDSSTTEQEARTLKKFNSFIRTVLYQQTLEEMAFHSATQQGEDPITVFNQYKAILSSDNQQLSDGDKRVRALHGELWNEKITRYKAM